jgi:hypothetical protein
MPSRRVTTPNGTWAEGPDGSFTLRPASKRGGISGPLEAGHILRSKLIKSIGMLIRELYPNAAHHSDRVMREEITVVFGKEKVKRKPFVSHHEGIVTSYADLLEEPPS